MKTLTAILIVAKMMTYLNLLASQHNLTIDWDTSDIEKEELNFIGGTDHQIMEFITELTNYCISKYDQKEFQAIAEKNKNN